MQIFFIFELDEYDSTKPIYYDIPYGFDLKIKDMLLNKWFRLSIKWDHHTLEEEVNRQVRLMNLPGKYSVHVEGPYIYLKEYDKYKFVLMPTTKEGDWESFKRSPELLIAYIEEYDMRLHDWCEHEKRELEDFRKTNNESVLARKRKEYIAIIEAEKQN